MFNQHSNAVGSRDSPGQGLGAHPTAGLCLLGGTGEGRRCLAHTAQHPDNAELKSNPGFQPAFSELGFLAGWPRMDTQLRAEGQQEQGSFILPGRAEAERGRLPDADAEALSLSDRLKEEKFQCRGG